MRLLRAYSDFARNTLLVTSTSLTFFENRFPAQNLLISINYYVYNYKILSNMLKPYVAVIVNTIQY